MRLVPGDPLWPAALDALRDPPEAMNVCGAWPLEGPAIAVVGARRASTRGLHIAREIARELAEAGVVVVSGGALGVDAAAHAGALDGGGRTLVVLPTPIDHPYPPRNRALFDRVLERGGAWLSEADRPVLGKASFLARNRIVAALAGAVVVVEASLRSGTRHTVGHARRLGRPVGAIPWDPGHPGGSGCIAVLKGGGAVLAGAADALALIGLRPRPRAGLSRPADAALDPLSRRVLARLLADPGSPESLAAALDVPLSDVLGALTTLELAGLAEPRAGGRYGRA